MWRGRQACFVRGMVRMNPCVYQVNVLMMIRELITLIMYMYLIMHSYAKLPYLKNL